MKKRPSRSLFDEQFKHQKLEQINDVLPRLSRMIRWEAFRVQLDSAFPVRDPKKGGQPRYDRVMMFKAIVLMELYGLSAEALEYQINDRASFQRFLGLEPQHQVPDHHGPTLRRTPYQGQGDGAALCRLPCSAKRGEPGGQ